MSDPDAPTSSGSATRKIKWLAIAVVVLIVVYSGGWLFLASRVDGAVERAIAQAEADGAEIVCEDQAVRGYPFRLGLRCASTGLATPDGTRVEAGTFRSAAQVYEPNRIVSELESPASFAAPGVAGTAEWSQARASSRFGTDGLQLGTLSLEDVRLNVEAEGAVPIAAQVSRALASIRPNGTDLDAALNVDGLDIGPIEGRDFPSTTLNLDATLSDAAGALGGEQIETLRGRTLTIRSAGLALVGGGRLEASGALDVGPQGYPTGKIEFGLSDPAATISALGTLFPDQAGVLRTVGGVLEGASGSGGGFLSGVLGGGNASEQQVTVVDGEAAPDALTSLTVSFQDGRARVGFIPLGRVPPLP